jgi:hypothetical protein
MSGPLPQLTYEQGRSCILPRPEAKAGTKQLDGILTHQADQQLVEQVFARTFKKVRLVIAGSSLTRRRRPPASAPEAIPH